MAKFMLLYRKSPEPAPRLSPEEMQAVQAAWGAWMGKFSDAILDGGDGLKESGRVLKVGGIVSDGPYVEAKEVIVSFSIVQADDYEGAVTIARSCPWTGGTIEIREFAGYT